ncbi:MAG: Y-family DNA polymerase [Bacteroidales bacterium]|nr:Y-family DNA polymerase [Bacteroidales bacterium]
MYGLIDCNNFYVSCERVFNPKLKNQAVVVLSNNDGCVISRSTETKALGIKMGEPAFKIEQIVKSHNIAMLSSNYELYGDMSSRVMNTIAAEAPAIEIYSIDEAFIELSNFKYTNLLEFAVNLRAKILKWTGIPVSVGIGKTKTLAKIATNVVKKTPIECGAFILETEEQTIEILKKIKVEDVWGIGRRYSKKLRSEFVFTAYDFITMPDHFVKKTMSIVGLKTKKELEGQSCINLQEVQDSKKTITTSRSFAKKQSDIKILEQAVAYFADNCGIKLRKDNSVAKYLTVYVRTDHFKSNLPQYSQAITVNLPTATDSSLTLIKYALKGLRLIYKTGFLFKKAAVTLSGIEPKVAVQGNIFDNSDFQHADLMKTIDAIREKFGKEKLQFGIQNTEGFWKAGRQRVSKAFTTKWDELLEVD